MGARKRRPQGYWTKETVVREILKRVNKGLSLQPKKMKEEYNILYVQGTNIFGGWTKAIEACGLDYMRWYPRRPENYWSKETVKEHLRKRRDNGLSLVPKDIFKEDNALHQNMKVFYGSIAGAYEAIGEDIEEHRVTWKVADNTKETSVNGKLVRPKGYWNEQKVKDYILNRKSKGLSLSPGDVHKVDKGLYTAGVRLYGNWAGALESVGIDYRDWYKLGLRKVK